MSLCEDADRYIAWLRDVRKFSTATVTSYRSTMRQLCEWVEQRGITTELTVGELEDFAHRPRWGDREAKPASVARDIATLKSFFAWREREGGKNVAVDLFAPTVHNQNPKPIPDFQWQRLWDLELLTLQERAWLGLGFFCGLRRNELATVKAHQLDLNARKLVSFVRKGGGDHTLPIGTMIEVYEQKLPHLKAERLWPILESVYARGGPISGIKDPAHLARKMKRMCAAADIESHTPHALRHSTATNLLRAGVPLHLVTKLMNHTSPSTTMRYVRAGGDELSEWLNS